MLQKIKNMKVALVLVGFMRNWENNYPRVKKEILDCYGPDVYISSYTYSKWTWNSSPKKVNIEKVLEKYNPKKYIFRNKETCPEIDFRDNGSESIGREYSYRQLYGWYTHKLALDLFEFDEYDIIIKLRTDVATSGLKLDKENILVIPSWKYHPGPCEPHEAYVDYVAYGPPKYMKKYFNLFEKLEEMHHKKIDISFGETLLKNYIDTYVTDNVHQDDRIDWILRNEMWASIKGKYCPIIVPTTEKGALNLGGNPDTLFSK